MEKKTQKAVDAANSAPDSGIQELDDETMNQISGGSEFDGVPTVKEHDYNPNDKPRY